MSRQKREQNKAKYQLGIEHQAKLDWMHSTLMAASGVLAAVAFLVNSIPILIGSMVIAPVMPPMILVSIGLATGNLKSVLKGIWITFTGLFLATLSAVITTWLLSITGINPENMEIPQILLERVTPGWYTVIAALAAAVAGALAVSHRKQDTVVGVVASIALVPTVAGAGIAAALGSWSNVWGGLIMLGINIGIIIAVGWLVFIFFSEEENETDIQSD